MECNYFMCLVVLVLPPPPSLLSEVLGEILSEILLWFMLSMSGSALDSFGTFPNAPHLTLSLTHSSTPSPPTPAALHYAAENHNYMAIRLLVEAGGSISAKNKDVSAR